MAGEKILLIEDNAVNRDLTQFLLESQGYEVREAASAEEAFEILKTERPDLIVMDIQLPGMDGLEATKRLKENPPTRDIAGKSETRSSAPDGRGRQTLSPGPRQKRQNARSGGDRKKGRREQVDRAPPRRKRHG